MTSPFVFRKKFSISPFRWLHIPNLFHMKRLLLLTTLTASFAAPLVAQTGDAPPIDTAQLLQALKQLRDQNDSGMKARRTTAFQTVQAAATSPEKAVAYWKEAVKAVQFEGADKENAQLRDWREGDGEALNDRLCAGAVRLHLQWLALSLQHSAGADVKVLIPKILDHIAAVQADETAADRLQDQLDKAKDHNPTSPGARKNIREDSVVRKVHDQIMRTSITSGPVGRLLRVNEMMELTTGRTKNKDTAAGWELGPGNIDGIYNSIILPEYRANKDPRLMDYWDMVLKRETERAAEKKLDVEQRDWAQVKKPKLQWARTQDVLLLGYRNKAIGEMFNLVKAFPNHPEAVNWISQLEVVLTPPAASFAPSETPAPALIPGVPQVSAPSPVPAAVPANVPGVAPVRPPVPPTTTRPIVR
jgi:hypothetical protein